METMTSAIHANQQPNETMTQCVHRMRDDDETMTHEIRDQVEAANAPTPAPVVPPTADAPDDKADDGINVNVVPDMSWTVDELTNLAFERNIDLGTAKSKTKILALLTA